MKIYTKGGDAGQTSLFSGRRAGKDDPLVAAVGDLDELSSSIGLAVLANPEMRPKLRAMQKALYTISAILSSEGTRSNLSLDPAETFALEKYIDELSERLPPLHDFIYPGDSEASARLHMARAVARRAERAVSVLQDPAAPGDVLAYLNRMSDALFVMARWADFAGGLEDLMFKSPDAEK
ncbi:cob(I)yrinic acid a,c-diamide adenosyltransferase [Flaviflagellibacter deserti]|uniref:Corrinoid adenosyltransferase n=1 Tax=Flaviflagellibacter deserti TaxID=2267266 RepID=A0ABV9Z718_9HYPH